MSIQDWHAHAMSVDQQLQRQDPPPAPEPVVALAVPAPVVTVPVAPPAPQPALVPAPAVQVPVQLADLATVTPIPARTLGIAGRPVAVDADLRPVMADKLAGDLADLTRVLLGVASSDTVRTEPLPTSSAAVEISQVSHANPVAQVVEVVEPAPLLVALDLEPAFLTAGPAAEVEPLVPVLVEPLVDLTADPRTPHNEEPPTPAAPTPTVPVDVVLSELSFLDG